MADPTTDRPILGYPLPLTEHRSGALTVRGEEGEVFSRGLIHDWYHGPVSGAVESAATGRVHAFHMVAWDERQRERIYVLRPLPSDALDRLARAWSVTGGAGEPEWPWWAPLAFPTEAARAAGSADADAVLDAAGEAEYLLFTHDQRDGSGTLRSLSDPRIRAQVHAWLLPTPAGEDGFCYSDAPFAGWRVLMDLMAR